MIIIKKGFIGVVILSILTLISSNSCYSADMSRLEEGTLYDESAPTGLRQRGWNLTKRGAQKTGYAIGWVYDRTDDFVGAAFQSGIGVTSHIVAGPEAATTAIFLDRGGESFSLLQSLQTERKGLKLLQAGGFFAIAIIEVTGETLFSPLQNYTGAALVPLFASVKCIQDAFYRDKKASTRKEFETTETQYDPKDLTQGSKRLLGLLGHRNPIIKTPKRETFTARLRAESDELMKSHSYASQRIIYIPNDRAGYALEYNADGTPKITDGNFTFVKGFAATGSDAPRGVGVRFDPGNTALQNNITRILTAAKSVENKGTVEGLRVLEPSANILAKLKNKYTGDGEGSDGGSAHSDDQLTGGREMQHTGPWQTNALANG